MTFDPTKIRPAWHSHVDAMRRLCTRLWSTAAKDPKVPTSELDLILHLIHRIEDMEENAGYVRPDALSGAVDKVDTQGR